MESLLAGSATPQPQTSSQKTKKTVPVFAGALAFLTVICLVAIWARPQFAQHYFSEGKALQAAKNPANKPLAFKAFEKAAWLGNSDAMEEIGEAYANSIGVPRNDAKAFEWFRRSAEHGNLKGMFALGDSYATGLGVQRDNAKAVDWMRRSAEGGYSLAQFNMGTYCHDGSLLQRDEAKAVEWFKKAAESGEIKAMHNLGLAYFHGDGIAQNYESALSWFRQAAAKGDSESAVNAAEMYLQGAGTPIDRQQGMIYMEKAADMGNPKAMTTVAKAAFAAKDVPKALKYFEKCANSGDPNAMVFTAALYAAYETENHISISERLEKSNSFLSAAMKDENALSPEVRAMIPKVQEWQAELSQKIAAPTEAEGSQPSSNNASADDSTIISCYDNALAQKGWPNASAASRAEYASAAAALPEYLNGPGKVEVGTLGQDRQYLIFAATPQNERALEKTANAILSNPSLRGRMCTERFAKVAFVVVIDSAHQNVVTSYKTRLSDVYAATKGNRQ